MSTNETDPLAGIPEAEAARVRAAAGDAYKRASALDGPRAGERAFDDAIRREVDAYHARRGVTTDDIIARIPVASRDFAIRRADERWGEVYRAAIDAGYPDTARDAANVAKCIVLESFARAETIDREEVERRLVALVPNSEPGAIRMVLHDPRAWLAGYEKFPDVGDREINEKIAAILRAYVRGLDARASASMSPAAVQIAADHFAARSSVKALVADIRAMAAKAADRAAKNKANGYQAPASHWGGRSEALYEVANLIETRLAGTRPLDAPPLEAP